MYKNSQWIKRWSSCTKSPGRMPRYYVRMITQTRDYLHDSLCAGGHSSSFDDEPPGIDPGGYHDELEVGAISLGCQRLPAMRASCVMTLSMCMRRSGALMSRTMPAREGEPGEGGRARRGRASPALRDGRSAWKNRTRINTKTSYK